MFRADLGMAYIQDAQMKDVEEYIKNGRIYSKLTDAELEAEFLRRVTSDFHGDVITAGKIIYSINELQPEFSLRNKEAPYDYVKDEINKILDTIGTAVEEKIRTQDYDSEAADKIEEDYLSFLNSLKNPN